MIYITHRLPFIYNRNFYIFQAQSDIEWKYGLSKLIRNMHRTNTAPSPLNLVTTWLMWLIARCKVSTTHTSYIIYIYIYIKQAFLYLNINSIMMQDRMSKKKRPSLVHMIGLQRQDQMSARSKAGVKWLSKVKRGQVVPKGNIRLFLNLNISSCQNEY